MPKFEVGQWVQPVGIVGYHWDAWVTDEIKRSLDRLLTYPKSPKAD